MDKPAIALVTEEFPPHTIGGVGTFCSNLANRLSKKQINTKVFSCGPHSFEREIVNDYLEVVRFPSFNFPPRYIWFQLRNFVNFSRNLQGVSLIHSATPEVSPICVYLKRKLKIPLITSYHGVTSYEMGTFINSPPSQWTPEDFAFHILEYPLYNVSNSLSITHSNHIISCSYSILNEMRTIYHNLDLKKSSVINNGIDLDEISRAEEICRGLPDNKNDHTLVFYGRLSWLKGTPYLLEAFTRLLKEYPNTKLKIFGKGPMEDQIFKTISKFGLEQKVHVYGQIPREKLLLEIIKSDIVVLPSLREAQPISVLEAMACKKPVVVFNFPFAKEYVRDTSNGLLANPKDSKDLAEKIEILISDNTLRKKISQNSFEYIKKYHNWENLIDEYINLYRKVAA